MTELQTLLQELCHAGRHPEETIRASMAETGKPAVGCFPLFVPEELVYAAGFLPVGLWGGTGTFQRSNRYIQSFACSILRADLELGLAGKYDLLRAVLIPTQCDTLKCVCEDFKAAVPQVPVIGVTIPHNRTIQAAHGQLLDEFDYLTASLRAVQTPDCRPMPLEEAFAVYEDHRAAVRAFLDLVPDHLVTVSPKVRHLVLKAAWSMDKRLYTEKLRRLTDLLKAQPKEDFDGHRFVVTGILLDAEPVLDLLEELHVGVVDDLLCHESLQVRTPTRPGGTVSSRLAYRYLDLRGASPLHDPGKPRGAILAQLVRDRGADAVLFAQMKFCDPEAFDRPIVAQDLAASGIPMLTLEHDQLVPSVGQLRTRLQAFLETALS